MAAFDAVLVVGDDVYAHVPLSSGTKDGGTPELGGHSRPLRSPGEPSGKAAYSFPDQLR